MEYIDIPRTVFFAKEKNAFAPTLLATSIIIAVEVQASVLNTKNVTSGKE
jgi:hypothetical protein